MKKQAANDGVHFPRRVAKRILERGARGEKKVVVVLKDGRPTSVWGFEEYLERMKMPKTVKPWAKRRSKPSLADRLGAIDAAPPQPLTRASMYGMDED